MAGHEVQDEPEKSKNHEVIGANGEIRFSRHILCKESPRSAGRDEEENTFA